MQGSVPWLSRELLGFCLPWLSPWMRDSHLSWAQGVLFLSFSCSVGSLHELIRPPEWTKKDILSDHQLVHALAHTRAIFRHLLVLPSHKTSHQSFIFLHLDIFFCVDERFTQATPTSKATNPSNFVKLPMLYLKSLDSIFVSLAANGCSLFSLFLFFFFLIKPITKTV